MPLPTPREFRTLLSYISDSQVGVGERARDRRRLLDHPKYLRFDITSTGYRYRYRVQVQGTGTGYRYRVQVQGQRTGTGYRYRVQV